MKCLEHHDLAILRQGLELEGHVVCENTNRTEDIRKLCEIVDDDSMIGFLLLLCSGRDARDSICQGHPSKMSMLTYVKV